MSLLTTVFRSLLEKNPASTNSPNCLGNMSYSLQGPFSYGSVVSLGNLINPNFEIHLGYIKNGIPVALIGIPGRHNVETFLDVWEYGKGRPRKPIRFSYYDEETARKVQSFHIYGDLGFDFLRKKVQFEKVSLTYDTRMRIKSFPERSILEMDYEFYGVYSYDYIQKLIKLNDFRYTSSCIYGKVGEKNVAIIGLNSAQVTSEKSFRRVWELGKDAPPIETFCLMDYSEASKVKDFTVFGYLCFFDNRKKYPISKINRTIDPRFNFNEGSKDIRLVIKKS